jgi:hypothetical protein
MKLLVISAGLTVLACIGCSRENTTPISYWTENIGSDKTLPLLPDSNVNYFLYSFTRHKGDKTGIRIKGRYGYARYMSYNVYDNNTLSSVTSRLDMDIQPDVGYVNPFLPSSDPDASNRNYSLNICPSAVDSTLYRNLLTYDDNIENIGIILRYYLPRQNNYAGVDLPSVEAFDITTGASVEAPVPLVSGFDQQFQQKYKKIAALLSLAGLLEAPKDVRFYRFSGVFLYPNKDNYYLFAPVTFKKGQVIMLRFKAPAYAMSNVQNGLSDVRYFSICLCDAKTYTHSTATDLSLVKAASDGYINMVIADDDPAVRAKAAGLNFVALPPELKNNVKGLIIYRHLLTHPAFAYPMGNVPDVATNISLANILNLPNIQAQTYMGNYAPVARKMTREQFLDNFNGFPVSY